MTPPIYMDHHATTPVDPRVVEAMLPFFTERFGNAASRTHAFGWDAERAVSAARRQVAALVGASAREIVFTSGATEAVNLAIKGIAARHRHRGDHVITSAAEHRAGLDACRRLEEEGFRVTWLPVRRDGLTDPADVARAIDDRTILVSIMTANNEVGVLQPMAEIARVTRARGVPLHTDATQAAGKIPFDAASLGVDLASFSAHKMYGPKGVGALYVRRLRPRLELAPLIDGGGHEGGLRSGTLNVPAIVGFGRAAEIGRLEMAEEAGRLARLRDRLLDGLRREIDEMTVNGSMAHRLPHNLHVSFAFVDGENLLTGFDRVALSSGAACTSASAEPSHVLRAMGVGDELARASLRFGLGRFNTVQEVDDVVSLTASIVKRLREMSPR